MDYAAFFTGLDEATVTDRLPKHTNGAFDLEVTELKIVDGQHGMTFVIENTVRASTNDEFPEGSASSITITGLKSDSKTKRAMALGNLKGFLAACLHLDPESQQSWVGLATMCMENELLKGALFKDTAQDAQTKPSSDGKSWPFIRHSYAPHPDNQRTLANIVAGMQDRQSA